MILSSCEKRMERCGAKKHGRKTGRFPANVRLCSSRARRASQSRISAKKVSLQTKPGSRSQNITNGQFLLNNALLFRNGAGTKRETFLPEGFFSAGKRRISMFFRLFGLVLAKGSARAGTGAHQKGEGERKICRWPPFVFRPKAW